MGKNKQKRPFRSKNRSGHTAKTLEFHFNSPWTKQYSMAVRYGWFGLQYGIYFSKFFTVCVVDPFFKNLSVLMFFDNFQPILAISTALQHDLSSFGEISMIQINKPKVC